ncbi:MAG: DUF6046 domain-containing protein [Bacteroidota bacterium]
METDHTFATGYNLPPFFLQDMVVIMAYDKNDKSLNYVGKTDSPLKLQHQFPLTFKVKGLEDFTFPIDPIITMGFKNVITRRTVSKGTKRGSIKERWTEDDVDITISGVFISEDGTYPVEVDKLRAFFEQHTAIDVVCTLLNERNINQIAIESFELPFTKGKDNQAFQIKAFSDDVFQLLIEN